MKITVDNTVIIQYPSYTNQTYREIIFMEKIAHILLSNKAMIILMTTGVGIAAAIMLKII